MKHAKQSGAVGWAAGIFLLAILALPAWGQLQNLKSLSLTAACPNMTDGHWADPSRYRAIHDLEDPSTHQHWLLLQDLSRPTGPAVLIELPLDLSCAPFRTAKSDLRSPLPARELSIPIIHPGDRIILSEHTRAFDAELEATALQAAAVGDVFTIRMKFGGLTLHAIATSPGRANTEASERLP